jgi:hypothetical protein
VLLAEKGAAPTKGLAKRRKNEYTYTYDSAVGRGAGMTGNMRFLGGCSRRGFRWIFRGTGAVLYRLQEMVHKEYIQL